MQPTYEQLQQQHTELTQRFDRLTQSHDRLVETTQSAYWPAILALRADLDRIVADYQRHPDISDKERVIESINARALQAISIGLPPYFANSAASLSKDVLNCLDVSREPVDLHVQSPWWIAD